MNRVIEPLSAVRDALESHVRRAQTASAQHPRFTPASAGSVGEATVSASARANRSLYHHVHSAQRKSLKSHWQHRASHVWGQTLFKFCPESHEIRKVVFDRALACS